MGWYFTIGGSRKDVIAEIINGSTWTDSEKGQSCRVLRKSCAGNVLWVLHEREDHGAVAKWIGCYLLERSNEGGGMISWGYKPMDEDMGPCYYTCPKSYIAMADLPRTDNSRIWRESVMEYWVDRKKKVAAAKARRAGFVAKTSADIDWYKLALQVKAAEGN
jgi:hypothetical protein